QPLEAQAGDQQRGEPGSVGVDILQRAPHRQRQAAIPPSALQRLACVTAHQRLRDHLLEPLHRFATSFLSRVISSCSTGTSACSTLPSMRSSVTPRRFLQRCTASAANAQTGSGTAPSWLSSRRTAPDLSHCGSLYSPPDTCTSITRSSGSRSK